MQARKINEKKELIKERLKQKEVHSGLAPGTLIKVFDLMTDSSIEGNETGAKELIEKDPFIIINMFNANSAKQMLLDRE